MMLRTPVRAFNASRGMLSDSKGQTVINTILHGSNQAKSEHASLQHSARVGRGKYIHEVITHVVQPGQMQTYIEKSRPYFEAIRSDVAGTAVKLTGSWRTVLGDQDVVYHILEHQGTAGYDASLAKLPTTSEHITMEKEVLPLLRQRKSELFQEFAFLPSSPPNARGGVFELRQYVLKPGTLLEWESVWKLGIAARKNITEPVGAWYSQIGHLNRVMHMWQYGSLHARQQARAAAWSNDGWNSTVSKTASLCTEMSTSILTPLPWSPLR